MTAPGKYLEGTHSAYQLWGSLCHPVHQPGDHPAGFDQSVVPKGHGGAARMIGKALHPHSIPEDAHDPMGDSDLKAFLFQCSALLDMQLQIAAVVLSAPAAGGYLLRRQAMLGHVRLHGGIHRHAGKSFAAEGSADYIAFFFNEPHDLERAAAGISRFLQTLYALNSGQNAVSAVIHSSAGNCVQMRADAEPRALPGGPSGQIAYRVHLCLKPRFSHPAFNQPPALLILR